MSARQAPLIVLVNDDGIRSPGLRAMARGLIDLGELLIVAPRDQQTSSGRSFRGGGVARPVHFEIDGRRVRAFAVATTPALAVRYAGHLVANRKPALVVSGINYGENVGNGVTISGTVGATLEAASMGCAALAVSQSVPVEYHLSYSDKIDFSVAATWGRRFARRILTRGMPRGADVVNLNVPQGATRSTPWRWTRTSRMDYSVPIVKETPRGKSIDGYRLAIDPAVPEPDSDIRAILVDRVVSVSLLTMDLTANVSGKEKETWGK